MQVCQKVPTVCYREFTEQWPKTILVCWQHQARFGSGSLNMILIDIIHLPQLVTTMIHRNQNNNSALTPKNLSAFYKYQLHLSYIKSSVSLRKEPGMEDSRAFSTFQVWVLEFIWRNDNKQSKKKIGSSLADCTWMSWKKKLVDSLKCDFSASAKITSRLLHFNSNDTGETGNINCSLCCNLRN